MRTVGPAHKVLVVDDEPALRMVVGHTLQDEGYSVRTAVDGAQALALCEQALPDLMILDLNMPRMSGFRVLEALDGRDWRHFPVMVVTGHRGAARKLDGAADAILMKPFDLDELCMQVKRLLAPLEKQAELAR